MLEIIQHLKLEKYVSALLDYWEIHPPQLSHGFSHAIKVAKNVQIIGIKNNFPDIFSLIIGALYHDIYRPVEAKDAEEDQSPGIEITNRILKKLNTPPQTIQKVHDALSTHDSWRGQSDAPLFSVILSLADKAAHDQTTVYGYSWASNKNAGKPVYTNHLQSLYAISKYQTRAWEVIYKHQIPGSELAAKAYLNIFKFISDEYLNDPASTNFFKLLDDLAEVYRNEEITALKTFGRSPASIKKIMQLC